jgi:hypothetical protein
MFSYNPARIKCVDTTNQCEQSATIIHREPARDFYTKQFILLFLPPNGIYRIGIDQVRIIFILVRPGQAPNRIGI